MKSHELYFERPTALEATLPPERSGRGRDEVRLLVTTPEGHSHSVFSELAGFLRAGDLLVVNESVVLPASLPAQNEAHLRADAQSNNVQLCKSKVASPPARCEAEWGGPGEFLLNLSTHYGGGLWLAEPRWSTAQPGPLPLQPGDRIMAGGAPVRLLIQHHGLPRLWFVQFEQDWEAAVWQHGKPIRYGYVQRELPLQDYQTLFARRPGSAEMPSAARPFTPRVLQRLRARGVGLAGVTLHTGVSSHEVEAETVEEQTLYAEPFWVPAATARAVNQARAAGRRVIAVGTTVVRALESAWDGAQVRPVQGFTRLYIHPTRGVHTIDGLLTGLHDSMASHLAMLYAIVPLDHIRSAYDEAIRAGYLWHEFGDSHLILSRL